jgi:hypothetical protein
MVKLSFGIALCCVLACCLASCGLFDPDAPHELSVTVFENISGMDVRDSVDMTISVPGSQDQHLSIRYDPNVMFVGNSPYGGVDDYDVVDISWYGKKEATIKAKVGETSADIRVSKDLHWFMYEHPSRIYQ